MNLPTYDDLLHSAQTIARLHTRGVYAVGGSELERVEAWRRGAPRPERSVRTSAYLANVALTTVTRGASWERICVVDAPLTWYQRYLEDSWRESQAAGERIRITPRPTVPYLPVALEAQDCVVFDRQTAVLLAYDAAGGFAGERVTVDRDEVQACLDALAAARSWSVSLNEYLSERSRVPRVA